MAFMDKVSKTFTETGQKTKGMVDITKLNGKITENNHKLKQIYTEIGEQYCHLHAEDPEAALQEQVKSACELKEQNNQWNDQIQTIRGFVKCPHCGDYIANNAAFCTSCGQRVLPEDVSVCPSCGAVSEAGAMFCSECGTRLPESQSAPAEEPKQVVICKCGTELDEDTLFCPVCGTRKADLLSETSEADVSTANASSVVQEQTAASEPASESEVPPINKEPAAESVTTPVTEQPEPECKEPPITGQPAAESEVPPVSEQTAPEREVPPVQAENEQPQTSGSEVRRCPQCGTELGEEDRFCTECGAPVQFVPADPQPAEKVRCPNCGAEQDPQALFCMECGTKLQ